MLAAEYYGVAYRVAFADRCTRVIDASRDTNFLELIAQRAYERLEVGM
jgi:hypothetical protein